MNGYTPFGLGGFGAVCGDTVAVGIGMDSTANADCYPHSSLTMTRGLALVALRAVSIPGADRPGLQRRDALRAWGLGAVRRDAVAVTIGMDSTANADCYPHSPLTMTLDASGVCGALLGPHPFAERGELEMRHAWNGIH
jgi:hypothetical protein